MVRDPLGLPPSGDGAFSMTPVHMAWSLSWCLLTAWMVLKGRFMAHSLPQDLTFCVLHSLWDGFQRLLIKCFKNTVGNRSDEAAAACAMLCFLGVLVSGLWIVWASCKKWRRELLWCCMGRGSGRQCHLPGAEQETDAKPSSLAPSSCLHDMLVLTWLRERQCALKHSAPRELCKMTSWFLLWWSRLCPSCLAPCL